MTFLASARSSSPRIAAASRCWCLGVVALLALAALPAPGLRAAEAANGGWVSLFNGKDLAGWHTFGTNTPMKWVVQDGAIAWTDHAGDIATDAVYGNFELEFDWKISSGGNSGVLWHVDESAHDRKDAPRTGPEYQVLDDANNHDGKNPKTCASSLYGLYAPSASLAKPVGEWNSGKIVVRGPKVEYWLNGQRVVETEVGSDDWKKRVADSKFSTWERYAKYSKGVIVLQDHNAPVWYRSVRIRPLN